MYNLSPGKYISVGVVATFLILGIFIYTNNESDIPERCRVGETPVGRLECLRSFFGQLTRKRGASFAVNKAKELQEEKIIDDCHLASHFVGNAQYEKHKDSVGAAFAMCPMACTEGCFHGVMESYIEEQENSESMQELDRLCDDISGDQVLKRQCIHGIGHGLFRHNSDILSNALSSCEVFKNQANVCQGGVFMENMNNYLLLEEDALRSKLNDICSEAEKSGNKQFAVSCYRAVGEGLMFYTGHDLEKSKAMCMEIKKEYAEICIDSAEKQLSTSERQL